jgi:F0F1-type ATP synthase assembly protein I
MTRVALVQVAVTAFIASISWLLGNTQASITALLCGAACAVPNALLAAHLGLLARWQALQSTASPSGAQAQATQARTVAAALLFGEFLKVLLTIALLTLIVVAYRSVVWKALVASLCACLFVQPFVLNRRTRSQ